MTQVNPISLDIGRKGISLSQPVSDLSMYYLHQGRNRTEHKQKKLRHFQTNNHCYKKR